MEFFGKWQRIFSALILVLIFALWVFLLYKIPATEIVAFVGVQNSYIMSFILAVIGGTSIFFPFPYYLAVLAFAAGGANPFLLALFAGAGVTAGDSTSYLVGYNGREILPGNFSILFKRLYDWASTKPKWMLFMFFYLYPALSPLSNDLVIVPLGASRFSYYKLMIPMFLGNITFNFIIALSGVYGFHYFLG